MTERIEAVKNTILTACISCILTGAGFWIIVGGRLASQVEVNQGNIQALMLAVDRLTQTSLATTVEQARLTERLSNYLDAVGIKR